MVRAIWVNRDDVKNGDDRRDIVFGRFVANRHLPRFAYTVCDSAQSS